MKKKWLISSIVAATVGGGFYVYNKFFKNEELDHTEKMQIQTIIQFYENKGYKVQVYNQNSDFILFHYENNEKKHLFYDNGSSSFEDFSSKLNAYYFHFTNEFYFVAKNQEILETVTKAKYNQWFSSLNKETIKKHGKIRVHFETVDSLLLDDEK